MQTGSTGATKRGLMEKGNVKALLPIAVFLVLYLGLGILFEYGMSIPMGFYNIPIVVVFMAALLVACFQNRTLSFDEKLVIMGRGIGDKTIVTMILIFITAGVFVGTVGRNSAESVAFFMLDIIPPEFAVAVLFVVSCFVSLSMGTSVGTITLITPIAVAVSTASGFSLPLCVASVMGGAMFGDNLSFISDTTIAACQGQGCQMKDKFRENFKIALPAALVTLAVILIMTLGQPISDGVADDLPAHRAGALPHRACRRHHWRERVHRASAGHCFRRHYRGSHRFCCCHRPSGQHRIGRCRHVRDHHGRNFGKRHLRPSFASTADSPRS